MIIPIIVTIVILMLMFRSNPNRYNIFDMTPILRLLWLIPLSFTWTIYFGLRLVFK